MKNRLTVLFLVFALIANAQVKQLKVSANKRFFQTVDGKPFFWIGDTGWLLFVKCSREDAIRYLETRKQQGFNVVQVMVLHDMNNTKNVYGDFALINEDASKPNITPGNISPIPLLMIIGIMLILLWMKQPSVVFIWRWFRCGAAM